VEAIPQRELKLDMHEIADQLEQAGLRVEAVTTLFILFEFSGMQLTLFNNGKVLVKNVKEPEKAEEVAKRVYELLQLDKNY
jgi:TATA-box binding protein (TBP) (component of TFIID and TFIIIB)